MWHLSPTPHQYEHWDMWHLSTVPVPDESYSIGRAVVRRSSCYSLSKIIHWFCMFSSAVPDNITSSYLSSHNMLPTRENTNREPFINSLLVDSLLDTLGWQALLFMPEQHVDCVIATASRREFTLDVRRHEEAHAAIRFPEKLSVGCSSPVLCSR